MSKLEEDLKQKVDVSQKHVATCSMNRCTRGQTPAIILALEENEGAANTVAEAHKNWHRSEDKRIEAILSQHRADTAEKAQ